MDYNRKNKANDVNGMFSQARHVSSGSGYVEDQATYSHQPVTGTTIRRYSREDNNAVMECYFKSRPGVRGYRKIMYELWKERGGFDISEQRLADQARTIKKHKHFTEEKLHEIEEGTLQELVTTVDEEDHEELDRDIEEDVIVQHERPDEPTIRILRVRSSETEKVLVEKIIEERSRLTNDRPRLSTLRHIERVKLLRAVRQINEVLDCVEINNITH